MTRAAAFRDYADWARDQSPLYERLAAALDLAAADTVGHT